MAKILVSLYALKQSLRSLGGALIQTVGTNLAAVLQPAVAVSLQVNRQGKSGLGGGITLRSRH